MKNDYEIRGDVTAIIINSPKYGRHEALISTNKLERAMEFPNAWGLEWSELTGTFYCKGNGQTINGKRSTVKVHRWITDCPNGMEVDHRDHDTLNNTDLNLRIVSPSENQQNRKGVQSNSTSGIRGVSWHKGDKKWRAAVQTNGKTIYLGSFTDILEAGQVAKEARMRYMPFSEESL